MRIRTPSDVDVDALKSVDCNSEFREIPGWSGYFACSNGTIWSFARSRGWKQLSTYTNPYGYLEVALSNNSNRKNFKVHHLILLVFHGNRPDGMVGCHCNGNQKDNRSVNLKWKTQAGNIQDSYSHGTAIVGSKSKIAKINENDVVDILKLNMEGVSQIDISKRYGVSFSLISRICRGTRWRHVKRGLVGGVKEE